MIACDFFQGHNFHAYFKSLLSVAFYLKVLVYIRGIPIERFVFFLKTLDKASWKNYAEKQLFTNCSTSAWAIIIILKNSSDVIFQLGRQWRWEQWSTSVGNESCCEKSRGNKKEKIDLE